MFSVIRMPADHKYPFVERISRVSLKYPKITKSRFYFPIVFLSTFIIQMTTQVRSFLRIKRLEDTWNDFEVMKLKSTKTKIEMVKLKHLKIGDLVLLQNNSISPADLLVVATSDVRHGESIFHTNEQRIDGQNIFYTKRAVRNLMTSTKSRKLSAIEAVNKLRRILGGYVEYDPPHSNIKFRGVFKLNNDPKISPFSSKNTVFAGTKLCSSWY